MGTTVAPALSPAVVSGQSKSTPGAEAGEQIRGVFGVEVVAVKKRAGPTQAEIREMAIQDLLRAVLPKFDVALTMLGDLRRTKRAAMRVRRIRQAVARLPMYRDGGCL